MTRLVRKKMSAWKASGQAWKAMEKPQKGETMYTTFRGGYGSKHSKGFVMMRPNGLYCYLFLIIRCPAYVKIGEKQFTVEANTAVIISPNIPYEYGALEGEYKNDWLYFESSDPDFAEAYQALFNRPIPLDNGPQFTQYVQHIVWERSYGSEAYRQDNISMLFQVMLNKLRQELENSNSRREYNPYATSLQELRLHMQSRPEQNYTPAQLAARLKVSPSYFQFLYKDFFGIPFKADLIQMRVEYAQDLILETELPMNQIAELSGYSNEIHFYRQFKARTGMTPKEYRRLRQRGNLLTP